MSEKLRRCRKELSAAIDRALECTVLPTLVQVQNASGSLRHTWQRSPTNLRHVGYRRIPFGDSSSLNQPMENIQPAPVTGHGPENNRSRTSFKRRPFSSRENLLKRPYNSNHTGKSARSLDTEAIAKSDDNLYTDPCGQEITRDLLDIIESTSLHTLEELTRTLDCEAELSGGSSPSPKTPHPGDVMSLLLGDGDPANEAVPGHPSPSEDDTIIETVLDLEQDYDLPSCVDLSPTAPWMLWDHEKQLWF
ncbi:uncharacterized protein C3orf62 homolog isoform X2 [Ascaphus truei]